MDTIYRLVYPVTQYLTPSNTLLRGVTINQILHIYERNCANV